MFDKFIKEQQQSETNSDDQDKIDSPEAGDENFVVKNRLNLTKLTFAEFASLGLPIMLIFLLISSIYITLIYRW